MIACHILAIQVYYVCRKVTYNLHFWKMTCPGGILKVKLSKQCLYFIPLHQDYQFLYSLYKSVNWWYDHFYHSWIFNTNPIRTVNNYVLWTRFCTVGTNIYECIDTLLNARISIDYINWNQYQQISNHPITTFQ